MPARVFLDGNVLIYSVGDDEVRRQLAGELIAAGAVVSALGLAERLGCSHYDSQILAAVRP